ncbi:MAG: T9SS type A sorting domain-containing protein [Chlorobi bacterium]|nr:T9SS type A sorting domain-containing protein [Chlorobiota bacterium]
MKRIVCLMMIILCSVTQAEDFDKEHLPKLLGSNNSGTEFYLSFIVQFNVETTAKTENRLFISSVSETEVLIERKDKAFSKTIITKANEVIYVDLPDEVAQPYIKISTKKPLPEDVMVGGALHVKSNAPIVVYGVSKILLGGEGFLAIPVSVFGNEYITNTWNDPSTSNYIMGSWTNIVAAYDNTSIRFKLGGTSSTETSGGLKPGRTKQFEMNAGDVVCIGTASKNGDITGSVSTGDRPFGVLSGVGCAFIPTGVWACDMIVSMELPTSSWGKIYPVSTIDGRSKSSFIRIVSKESNTTIYRDGLELGFIETAGGINGRGWLSMRATQDSSKTVVISADKPVGVTQFNPGANDDGANSDPFQMVLAPYEKYQNDITFHTPGVQDSSIGFLYNYVNIIYKPTEAGTIPDDLQIATFVDGNIEWKQLNAISSDPGKEFEYTIKGQRIFMKTYQLPGDGVYRIKANDPIGAYLYGMSKWDAYGYPASVALEETSGIPIKDKNKYPTTSLKLMPSPVRDVLIIQNTGAALNTDKISIIDLNGKTIFEEQINVLQDRYEINTSTLINGMYILRIHLGDRIISEKFTVGR